VGDENMVKTRKLRGPVHNMHNDFTRRSAPQRVRDLLEDGAAELNTTAGFGTPLHHAVRWGHAEIVTLLLEAGADATARNADGHDAAALAERSPGDDETGGTVRVGSRRAELAAGRARCAQILAEHSARG